MATETRTVHLTMDPALKAYLAWCEAEGHDLGLEGFDLFAAGYRARSDEQEATPARPTAGGTGGA